MGKQGWKGLPRQQQCGAPGATTHSVARKTFLCLTHVVEESGMEMPAKGNPALASNQEHLKEVLTPRHAALTAPRLQSRSREER